MNEKRALVTGLNGFTGQYLARDLEEAGYVVYGINNHPCDFPKCYQVDLLDKEELSRVVREVRPTVVAHLAAISFVGHGNAEDIYKVNLIGVRNFLEALCAADVAPECVLLASSANVYGNSSESSIDEKTIPSPANDYAVSKLAMEYLARLWMDRLPIIISRPFNYTGVGQAPQFLLPKIVGHFQRREKVVELGNIDVERDFSDVRFVARAYCHLLQAAPAGEVFNICSGTAYSLKDVLAMMAEIAGYEIEVRINPDFVRPSEVKRLQGNPAKLEALIGRLTVIPLRETLEWMYSWGGR
jgi:nucleoside-diphosphate-sugar epimerase